jgi:hypothetical protein
MTDTTLDLTIPGPTVVELRVREDVPMAEEAS